MRSRSISLKHFIFYFLFTIIQLAAILAGSGYEKLVMITKPLLIPALTIVFYRLTRDRESNRGKYILAALFFSWLGDVSLIFQQVNSNFFLVGLACFLFAHIAYIRAFTLPSSEKKSLFRKHPWLILLFAAYGAFIFLVVHKGLGQMLIPVTAYMCVILVMGMSALNRFGKTSSTSFLEVFFGALLFMLSDSLLAINKFSQPIPSASFLIMFIYIIAQFFIVKGMVDENVVQS